MSFVIAGKSITNFLGRTQRWTRAKLGDLGKDPQSIPLPSDLEDSLSESEPLRLDRSRPLTFMHVPKTSGTALLRGLAATLQPSAIVNGFDHCLFGSFQEFDTIDASLRENIYASPAALPAGAELIAGHIAWSTLRQACPRGQTLTVLREPFSRLLSHWMYWRQHTDSALAPWGKWAEYVRHARKPLAVFLREPLLACQTDNLTLRMLLWPHPMVPVDRFIDPADDQRLVVAAMARLRGFNFVDIVENDKFVSNLQRWFGRAIVYDRGNETGAVPAEFRAPLHQELTAEAYELLEARSRLDYRLWAEIAADRVSGCDPARLRERALMANIARYGLLMSG